MTPTDLIDMLSDHRKKAHDKSFELFPGGSVVQQALRNAYVMGYLDSAHEIITRAENGQEA